jgi:hypothetical protein
MNYQFINHKAHEENAKFTKKKLILKFLSNQSNSLKITLIELNKNLCGLCSRYSGIGDLSG